MDGCTSGSNGAYEMEIARDPATLAEWLATTPERIRLAIYHCQEAPVALRLLTEGLPVARHWMCPICTQIICHPKGQLSYEFIRLPLDKPPEIGYHDGDARKSVNDWQGDDLPEVS